MKNSLPGSLIELAQSMAEPLYIVGGSVRDFLIGFPIGAESDFDLSSPCQEDKLIGAAERCGFTVRSVYRNTGTVKLTDKEGKDYEYTRFRSDKYIRGEHRPSEITFTTDIVPDAKRRDFCADAIYYDIKRGEFSDPLGGIEDLHRKILRTVAPASKVFGEDGLRLLRLARIAAQIGFTPDEECLAGAYEHRKLINDIVPERIFTEINLLLHADARRGETDGPYRGLKILEKTEVLNEILPELTLGKGILQRPDFHDHDVLEHSLRCVRYSAGNIRFAALFHDVGKPFCFYLDGNFHQHPEEGERITKEILTRWKAPKKLIERTSSLVRLHMRDYNLQMKESKVRRELIDAYSILDELLLLKQADFSACKDNLSPAPCVIKWKEILGEMRKEGAPLQLKELAISGNDLLAAGIAPQKTGKVLEELLYECAQDGSRNCREKLMQRIRSFADQ